MIGKTLDGSNSNFRYLHFEELGSTNTQLFELAKNGEPGNLWITAETQLAGKGSRGREWVCEKGNLFASLLLREPSEVAHLHELTFVAAAAVHQTIKSIVLPDAKVGLKWPNDVLIDRKKCCGILLESNSDKSGLFVVLGIGINCVSYPDNALHKATCLDQHGSSIRAQELFLILAEKTADALLLWDKGNGFDHIRDYWLKHSVGIGEEITVEIPTRGQLRGRFATIDEKGYLLLDLGEGVVERLSTADIFINIAPNSGE